MSVLEKDHFEGHSNLTKGSRKRSDDKVLAELLPSFAASSVGVGGAATEALTFEGLGADDQVLAVLQRVPGANNLPLLGWSTQIDGGLTAIWSADPGAGAELDVMFRKA